ncbi:DUF1285 domain-containing protein [Shimia marina]|uniref:DUF1285 domain-containing protein n=1 Tax=Shimia marina TaxID=321267 RepID=UPI00071E5709|nr:DUF1285 domain-containing protein [Shimia marina]
MREQFPVKVDADNIAASAKAASKGNGPAPVHLWNPPHCGDLDMRIARDGTWFYQGSPINRPALVRLFSNILRKDGDSYVLVTPVEKVGITVEDAPFVAEDFDVTTAEPASGKDQTISFVTHVGDRVTAGADTPIRVEFDPTTQEPAPYVTVRANLEARISRKAFYRLVDLGTHQDVDGTSMFGVTSAGTFFPFLPSEALD